MSNPHGISPASICLTWSDKFKAVTKPIAKAPQKEIDAYCKLYKMKPMPDGSVLFFATGNKIQVFPL